MRATANTMIPQRPSSNRSAPKSTPAYTPLTEKEWDAAFAAVLRAEINRVDSATAATATAMTESKYIMIDGLCYAKAWLVDRNPDPEHKEAEMESGE